MLIALHIRHVHQVLIVAKLKYTIILQVHKCCEMVLHAWSHIHTIAYDFTTKKLIQQHYIKWRYQ